MVAKKCVLLVKWNPPLLPHHALSLCVCLASALVLLCPVTSVRALTIADEKCWCGGDVGGCRVVATLAATSLASPPPPSRLCCLIHAFFLLPPLFLIHSLPLYYTPPIHTHTDTQFIMAPPPAAPGDIKTGK